MSVNLMGKIIRWGDEGPHLNVLHQVKNLKELVQASKELINQDCIYDPTLSQEISTESIVFIFKPLNSPDIILDLPVKKYRPFSEEFRRYEWFCRVLIKNIYEQHHKN